MQVFMTILVLAIWLWIGAYGFLASKKKKQTFVAGAWALLTVVIAIYIISTLLV